MEERREKKEMDCKGGKLVEELWGRRRRRRMRMRREIVEREKFYKQRKRWKVRSRREARGGEGIRIE